MPPIPAFRIGINAHLLTMHAGYRRAGIHQYIFRVLQNLPGLDNTTYHVYTRDSTSLGQRNDFRVTGSSWPTERRSMRILWEQSMLPWRTYKDKIDLLHSMAFVSPVLSRVPAIVTVYDLSFLHFPETFPAAQRLYLQSQTARSAGQARRIITISEASRRDLHRYLAVPLEKIDVVLPGVDPAFQPIPADQIEHFKKRNNLQKPFILHVGTLQPRKNIPLILRAMAGQHGIDVDLVIAGGKGWYYDEIFELVRQLGLAERVRFAGYVRDQDLPFWYNAANMLVFPSLYEGFGMPVVEAMACGTPVIATRSSSIPEAGGEAALYFDPQDVETLCRHISNLLNDPSLKTRLIEKGLNQARKFSWQKAGLDTAAVYARVLDLR